MHSNALHIETATSGAENAAVATENAPMRMAALVDRTGVPKTTILYYIREGLLPPPEKPFPNQAYYTEAHVDRLLLIKEAQRVHRLPLAKIRYQMQLVDRGVEPAAVARLSERLFAVRAATPSDRTWSLKAFCGEVGLDAAQVQAAAQAQVLNPLVDEPEMEFDSADVEVGHALRAGMALGITLEDLGFMVEHARGIADGEMTLRRRFVAGRSIAEDVELTADLTDMARTLHTYIVDRMFIATARRQNVGDADGGME